MVAQAEDDSASGAIGSDQIGECAPSLQAAKRQQHAVVDSSN